MSSKEKNIDSEEQNQPHAEEQGQDEKDTQTVEPEKQTEEKSVSDNKMSAAEEWESKYKEMNEKYVRLYSDFENFRKRTARERLDLMESAGSDVIKELLSVLDDFERALKNDQDEKGLREGVNLIHNKLLSTLKNKGLEPMDSQGNQFDYELHEAITKIPAPSKKEKGKVVDVVEKGYYFKGKVLRYAKVVVGE